MNSADFLDKVNAARRAWEGTVARVPADRLIEPILAGGWSVKDVIAHVAWSEREMIGVIRARALVGSPLWALGPDERNAAVFAENRDRHLAEVLTEERAIWAELLPGLESLGDDDLNDPSRFRELAETAPGVPPWQIFAGSTFSHFDDHARDIRVWLVHEPD